MRAQEQRYDAQQESWGLPSTADGAALPSGLSAPPPTAPRGLGRHRVRPAWLVRQEQERGRPSNARLWERPRAR